MTMLGALAITLSLLSVQTTPAPAAGTIVDIKVHGNQISADADVIAMSGLKVGDAFGPKTLDETKQRLEATGKFERVTVLQRFASIDDPSRLLIVIVVDEGPVRIALGLNPGDPVTIARRGWLHDFMYLPILYGEDGYGLTYGLTVTKPDVTSPRGRISMPLSWGGTRQVGLTFDRRFREGPFTRVAVGAAIERQENPAFRIGDTRRRVWARAERAMGPVRVGATTTWQHVSFGDISEDLPSVGGDVTFDTRVDPILPRNAVLATASVERFARDGGAASQVHLEARGYIGLIGQTVLALRVVREDANHPLPEYLQSLLGGWSSLRGFEAGAFAGDTMAAGSIELRVPLTSAVHLGKIGVSAFVDEGTAYAKGQRLADATWHRGTGGSVWLAATILQFGVSVAHAKGGGTRVNVGGGVTF